MLVKGTAPLLVLFEPRKDPALRQIGPGVVHLLGLERALQEVLRLVDRERLRVRLSELMSLILQLLQVLKRKLISFGTGRLN